MDKAISNGLEMHRPTKAAATKQGKLWAQGRDRPDSIARDLMACRHI